MLVACARQPVAPVPPGQCLDGLAFAEATLFAGATDYHFVSSPGVRVTFRVENGVGSSSGFDQFLAAAQDGPAETNEALVGQHYKVCHADQRIVAEPSGKTANAGGGG